jgi:hypothetical protein
MKPPISSKSVVSIHIPYRLDVGEHVLERQFIECGFLDRHICAEVDDPDISVASGDIQAVDIGSHNV